MRILITGANGFVGSHVSTHLSGLGMTCVALDLPNVEPHGCYAERYTWDELNTLDPRSFDGVIHLAGKAHDTRNTSHAESYFRINVGLTRTICTFFFHEQEQRAKKFIFFSSVKACADTVQGILTEEQVPDPKTPYGQSKLEAEKEVLTFERAHMLTCATPDMPCADPGKGGADFRTLERQNFRTYILRPAMIHGPGNKGNLNLLYQIAKLGFPWPLGSFTNQRSFASISNVAAVVEALLTRNVAGGIYNVADDAALSTNELIALMAEVRGKKPQIWRIPEKLIRCGARVGDHLHLPLNSERLKKLTESYVVSNAKLKKALGWAQFPMAAQDGLKITLRSFQS